MFKKIWTGIKERGWDKIPDTAKHFMGSFFLVLIFFGIPYQRFGWEWNIKLQLLIAFAISWSIGFWWEFRRKGNKSHKDIWVDFAGCLVGVLSCIGVMYA